MAKLEKTFRIVAERTSDSFKIKRALSRAAIGLKNIDGVSQASGAYPKTAHFTVLVDDQKLDYVFLEKAATAIRSSGITTTYQRTRDPSGDPTDFTVGIDASANIRF